MQDNSCDCGVYLLHYAEHFCRNAGEISKSIRNTDIVQKFRRYLGPDDFKPKHISKKRQVW
jgi:Ulp1 family protease